MAMGNSKVSWVLRSDRGQLRGPYDTSSILKQIKDGTLSGDEMIARYPGGDWVQISREPEFYDHLLNALASASEVSKPKKVTREQRTQEEDTVIAQPPKEQTFQSAKKVSGGNSLPPPAPKPPPVIELSTVDKIEKQQKMKIVWKPLAGIVLLLVAGLFIMIWPAGMGRGKIRLVAPKKGEEVFSENEIRSRTGQALADIQKDTPESYLQAQNKLVSLIEGAPRDLSSRALLCLVYKELWPYSFQDDKDLKVVTEFSQATKNLNLISVQGNICETIKLMLMGRVQQARGAVDNMFNNPDDDAFLSIVYLLKGELLRFDRDLVNAKAFFEDASKKGREWLKPKSSLALLLMEMNEWGPAVEGFHYILKSNPSHKTAQLGLGISLYEGFKKNEDAYKWLKSALSSSLLAPPELESESYYTLALLQIERGEKKAASDSAQKAYSRNPQSQKTKELLVRLGGVETIRVTSDQKNELIFLGDQYFRQGDYFSAQAQYKTAFEINPKNGTAAMKAAKCLWLLHQSNDAIEWLKKAVKADPKLVSAYVLQADYLSRRYDFFGATQILSAARRIAPNSYEIQRGFAQIEFRKNNVEGAIAYGLKALGLYQGDVENLVLLSQANLYLAKKTLPSSPKDMKIREEAAKNAKNYATKAVEIDGTSVEAQKNYALMLSMTVGVDQGMLYLEELIKKYSFSHEYRIALADLLRNEQRYPQAQAIYEQVVDADPKNKDAFLGLGDCYRAVKENTKALKAFLSAATLDPSDAVPIFEIGKLNLDAQKFDEAIKYFDRVSKINPNFPRTFYFVARAHFLAGHFQASLDEIKKEKKNNPYLSDSYLLAAEIHEALKQYNECSSEYSQAIKLRPQPAAVYVSAARCYRLGGSVEVAEHMVAIAASRESGFADVYREQGAIFHTKGEKNAAVKAYCMYLELSPNAPDRKTVEERLGELGFSSSGCNN
jgi:tetratricopeptide (TPR) repeat protein